MTNHPDLETTLAFIQMCHAGQVDKSGKDYWHHPVAVMNLLPEDATEDEKHVALLHDVIEDCGLGREDLECMGYNSHICDSVMLLSRPPAGAPDRPTYKQFIKSIADSGNRTAIRVKIADNKHNSSPERIETLPPEDRGIGKRYANSISTLEEALQTI